MYAGFTLSNATFNALVMRYSHRDGKMYFDDFVSCVARMKTMFGESPLDIDLVCDLDPDN